MNPLLVNLSVLIARPTGISTYATNLLAHLQPLNPTLLISPTGTDVIHRVSTPASNYTCYPVPPNLTPEYGTKGHLRRLLWTQMRLPRIYQKLRSHLLFSPFPEAPLYVNCRYIVTVHDLIPLRFPNRFSPLAFYHRYWIPQVLAQAQHIICNSTATAKDIINFFHINPEKITPILLAHDANHFRKLNLPKLNYFLYIGRYDPHKNLHRLIAAFAALSNYRDYELWLAGTPDSRYTPAIKADLERLGITHQVKFLDYVPYNQLPTLINQALALVFPSLWEGFGLPVLEAMACGTPVITSYLSSLPEIAGDAALLVDPYNIGEIAEAMQTIADNVVVRSHLSHLGISRASQFSWNKTGLATVEVLKRYL